MNMEPTSKVIVLGLVLSIWWMAFTLLDATSELYLLMTVSLIMSRGLACKSCNSLILCCYFLPPQPLLYSNWTFRYSAWAIICLQSSVQYVFCDVRPRDSWKYLMHKGCLEMLRSFINSSKVHYNSYPSRPLALSFLNDLTTPISFCLYPWECFASHPVLNQWWTYCL